MERVPKAESLVDVMFDLNPIYTDIVCSDSVDELKMMLKHRRGK